MKRFLISGSIAFDHIMNFDGEFSHSIVPDEIAHLSVSFLASEHKVFFGGCAPNIAFTSKLLGDFPFILGVAGNDFSPYKEWLEENKIPFSCIKIEDTHPTAAAYILADRVQNQIAFFSACPAALDLAEPLFCDDVKDVDLAIVGPDVPTRMIHVAEHLMRNKIPYIFDPGQAISSISNDYLALMIDGAVGVIANEYETGLLLKNLAVSIEHLSKWAGFLVQTLGEKGCVYYEDSTKKIIPALNGLEIKDVTGCGDAFRAGFLHAYARDEGLERSCMFGNVAASYLVEVEGTQTHKFSYDEFLSRLKESY